MRRRLSILLPIFLIACWATASVAQTPIPLAGTHFTFGITEGSDAAIPLGGDQSQIYLTLYSRYSGCALLISPSGYSKEFSFTANQPQQVTLDYNLMQLAENGTSTKGLLLTTSQPVTAYLHLWVPQGGDATQLFPDEAQDTAYVVGGYGLWNDFSEFNHSTVLVAAVNDGTNLTITPTVQTIDGHAAKQPIQVTLNRGETYILKADINAQPSVTSLSGTIVSASKPVAVFSGVTCAYVPIREESCNEMLDEIIGKKWWSTHYFAEQLGNGDSLTRVIITSDQDFLATMNGAFASSTNGRIETSFDKAVEITTTKPVLVQQITGGSAVSGFGLGDPTLVTVLPPQDWPDTLTWSIPRLGMANFAPIIVPNASIAQAVFDGRPLTSYGTPVAINGSQYSAIRLSVNPGGHQLSAPGGIFTMGVGFDFDDSYSFLPGSVGPERFYDTIRRNLVAFVDSAATCDTFSVAFSLDSALTDSSGAVTFTPAIRYDASMLSIVSITPGAVLQNSTYTIDTSTPGLIRILIVGKPLITGKDLFRVVFFASASGSAGFSNVLNAEACGETGQVFLGGFVPFSVNPSNVTMPRTFAIPTSEVSDVVLCNEYQLSLLADTTLSRGDRFVPIKIEYLYPPEDQTILTSTVSALLRSRYVTTSDTGGDLTFQLNSGAPVSGGDTLVTLLMQPRRVGSSPTKVVVTYVLCGDTLQREYDLTIPIAQNIDSSHLHLSMMTNPVTWGNQTSVDITMSGLPSDAKVHDFTLDLTYDHDVLSYFTIQSLGTLTNGWKITGPTHIDPNIERFEFSNDTATLDTSGILLHMLFYTYVTDSTTTPIGLSTSLTGSAACRVLYESPEISTLYTGKNLCGDSLVRNLLLGEPLALSSVRANDRAIDVSLDCFSQSVLTIDVFDLLGRPIEQRIVEVHTGRSSVELPLPPASGTYVVRVSGAGVVRSGMVQIGR